MRQFDTHEIFTDIRRGLFGPTKTANLGKTDAAGRHSRRNACSMKTRTSKSFSAPNFKEWNGVVSNKAFWFASPVIGHVTN